MTQLTKEQKEMIREFRRTIREGFGGNYLLNDQIIAINGTDQEVWGNNR